MKHIYLVPLFAFVSLSTAVAQTDYPHAEEQIGTVRQVYDGALLPDIQVNTFRNIGRRSHQGWFDQKTMDDLVYSC